MKWCLLFPILIPYSYCILVKPSDPTKEPLPASSNKGLEPRVSSTSSDDDKKEDLQAQQSIEHSHYDYPGGFGYGGHHGHHHYPGGYGGGGYGGGYGGGGYGHGSDLALKTLLIPLAGAALIGAAAIFAYNPLLIQLGVVAGKKKRSIDDDDNIFRSKYREIQQLEKFIDQLPKDQVVYQEKKLLASYLTCSGLSSGNLCMERLTCQLENPNSNSTALDRSVLNIVTNQIMLNEYVPETLKENIRRAKTVGLNLGDCRQFYCSQIDPAFPH